MRVIAVDIIHVSATWLCATLFIASHQSTVVLLPKHVNKQFARFESRRE